MSVPSFRALILLTVVSAFGSVGVSMWAPFAEAQGRVQKSRGKARGKARGRREAKAPSSKASKASRSEASAKKGESRSKQNDADVEASAEMLEEGGNKVKSFRFSGLDISGRLKSPQLLYFLNRLRTQFDRPRLPHRSFMPELQKSTKGKAF